MKDGQGAEIVQGILGIYSLFLLCFHYVDQAGEG